MFIYHVAEPDNIAITLCMFQSFEVTNFEVPPSDSVPETHETFLNYYIYKTRYLLYATILQINNMHCFLKCIPVKTSVSIWTSVYELNK